MNEKKPHLQKLIGSRRPLNVSIKGSAFGEYLRDLRLGKGWSKSELADAAGLSSRTIHDLEAGRRNRVQEKTLLLLADVLNIQYSSLMEDFSAAKPMAEVLPVVETPAWHHRVHMVLVTIVVFLVVLRVTGYFVLDNLVVTPVQKNDQLLGIESFTGRTMWQLDVLAGISFIAQSPWSGDEILVGLKNDAIDGGRLLLVHRKSGEILWTLRPDMEQLAKSISSDQLFEAGGFIAIRATAVDLDGDGEPELAADFMHGRYWPQTVIFVSRDGEVRGQYDSRGHIYDHLVTDLDNDGRQELVIAATNNAVCYQGASLILLDAECCHGAASDFLAGGASDVPDSSRYRLILPSFGEPYMELLGAQRLGARKLSIVCNAENDWLISTAVGDKGQNVLVTVDAKLRPLSVSSSDGWPLLIKDWPDEVKAAGGPQDSVWLNTWLEKAVWFEAGHWNGITVDSGYSSKMSQ